MIPLTTDSDEKTLLGDATFSYETKNVGTTNAERTNYVVEIEVPDGIEVPSPKVVGTTLENENLGVPFAELTASRSEDGDGVEILGTKRTEKGIEIEASISNENEETDESSAILVRLLGAGFEIEVDDSKILVSDNERNEDVDERLGEDWTGKELSEEETSELPDGYEYERVLTPKVESGSALNVSVTATPRKGEMTVSLDEVEESAEIRSLKAVAPGTSVWGGSSIGLDVGVINLFDVPEASIVQGSGFKLAYTNSLAANKYLYAKNVFNESAPDGAYSYYYPNGAMYAGDYYNVTVYYGLANSSSNERNIYGTLAYTDVVADSVKKKGTVYNYGSFDIYSNAAMTNKVSDDDLKCAIRVRITFSRASDGAAPPAGAKWAFWGDDLDDEKEGWLFKSGQLLSAYTDDKAVVLGTININVGTDAYSGWYGKVDASGAATTERDIYAVLQGNQLDLIYYSEQFRGSTVRSNYRTVSYSLRNDSANVGSVLINGVDNGPVRIGQVNTRHMPATYSDVTLGTLAPVSGYAIEGGWSPYPTGGYELAYGATYQMVANNTVFYGKYRKMYGDLTVTKNVNDPSGFHNRANTSFLMTLSGQPDAADEPYLTRTAWTNSSGVATFDRIPVGTYVLTESYPSYSGPSISDVWQCTSHASFSQTVAITEGTRGAGTDVKVSFANRYRTGTARVQKLFDLNKANLATTLRESDVSKAGFKFRLYGTSTGGDSIPYSSDGNGTISFVATSGTDGIATWRHVPVGTYSIVETFVGNQAQIWEDVSGVQTVEVGDDDG